MNKNLSIKIIGSKATTRKLDFNDEAIISEIVRKKILPDTKDEYLHCKVKIKRKMDFSPVALYAYLLRKDTYKVDVIKIDLDDSFGVQNITKMSDVPDDEDEEEEFERDQLCFEQLDFVVATPVPEIITAKNAVEVIYSYASSAGFKCKILLGEEATIANYQRYLVSGLKAFVNIGHGFTGGILLDDGILPASWFHRLQEKEISPSVLYFNSCEVFNPPLQTQIMQAGTRTFIGGIVNLGIGTSENVCKSFWNKVLIENGKMEFTLRTCEDELYPQKGAHGISGDKGLFKPIQWNKKARTSSGFLKQGNLGGYCGNFETIFPAENGFEHLSRDNDVPDLKWYGPTTVDAGEVNACTLIQSNFGEWGNLEAIVRCGPHLHFYWRDDVWPYEWHYDVAPSFSMHSYCGNPALIQGNLGGPRGNFEMVVPVEEGGLAHISRNNHIEGVPWDNPILFGNQAIQIDGVALIQSSFGSLGNLEIVAVEKVSGRLAHYWREDVYPYAWHGPYYFGGAGFHGTPALIQGNLGGSPGNFELVVPVNGGGLAHFSRSNNQQGLPWYGPTHFGRALVNDISMIQSNFGDFGHLEVVTTENHKKVLYWRDDTDPYNWHGPSELKSISFSTKQKTTEKPIPIISEEPVLV